MNWSAVIARHSVMFDKVGIILRALVPSVLMLLVACGSEQSGSGFSTERPSEGSQPDLDGKGDLGSAPPKSGDDSVDTGAACARTTIKMESRPLTLVFAFDRSSSMTSKWSGAKAAMKGFFSSPDTSGIKASIGFFPKADNMCTMDSYKTPAVPVTALPNSVFSSALDSTNTNGKTPTVAALRGAIDYAMTIQAAAPTEAVAVVIVTDGLPAGCSDGGDVGPSAQAAAGALVGGIPTYVVGVGAALENLNQVATAGGTKQAFFVGTDPAKTQQELAAAVSTIRVSATPCDYAIPPPPANEKLDPTKVNVQYTPTGAAATEIGYDATCVTNTGWRYDDASNPKRIVACPATCAQMKSQSGRVDIVLGCATRPVIVK